MQGVGNEHPSLLPVALTHTPDNLLFVFQGAWNRHSAHISGCEDVGEGLFLVDGVS